LEYIPDVSPEVPARPWRLILAMLSRLPERAMSRTFGRIADLPIPRRLRGPVLSTFARSVGIDLNEAEKRLTEYPTLNAFFVRRLRPGVRSWPTDPRIIASPVDGIMGRAGTVRRGRAVQAKGHDYSVADLLGSPDEAARYDGGSYVTLYLSPRHYHRIHTPCSGTISRATYIPGTLLPVNAPAVMHIPGLFARNERLVCYVEGERGRIAVVAVGAYNVGRISAAFDAEWAGTGRERWITNRRSPSTLKRSYDPPKRVASGDEIMAFHLGSTVVLFLEPSIDIRSAVSPGTEVRVGEPIST
jgi:phosphatidylserine decarboxylase